MYLWENIEVLGKNFVKCDKKIFLPFVSSCEALLSSCILMSHHQSYEVLLSSCIFVNNRQNY